MNSPRIPEQAINPPDISEWSDKDKLFAKWEMYDAILDGEIWDENFHYRADMCIAIENIIMDRDDDKEGRVRDVYLDTVRRYCYDMVEHDPVLYCEKYCDVE